MYQLIHRYREQARSYRGQALLGRFDGSAELLGGNGRIGFRIVDEVGHDIKERTLYRQRGRHVVRHARLQAAGLGVRQEVLGSGLGAGVETVLAHVAQHVDSNRNRTLVDAEDFLEVLTQHDLGNVLLSGSSDFVMDLRLTGQTGGGGNGPTPGRINSVYATNAPPAIRQVDHTPTLPTNGEPVKITAKVTDPDGVAGVVLQYQLVEPGAYIDSLGGVRIEDTVLVTTNGCEVLTPTTKEFVHL